MLFEYFRGSESRFKASEGRCMFFIDFDYDRIVIFANGFKFWLDNWQTDVVLTWPQSIFG